MYYFFWINSKLLCVCFVTFKSVFLFTHRLQKAYAIDQSYKYPMLIWDMLPHGGASQIHPHVHNFLDRTRYQGNTCNQKSRYQVDVRYLNQIADINRYKQISSRVFETEIKLFSCNTWTRKPSFKLKYQRTRLKYQKTRFQLKIYNSEIYIFSWKT